MKNKKLVIFMFLAVLTLIALELYIYLNNSKVEVKETRISFVVTGDNLDNWENMRAGAETAALDEHCVVDFVNSPVEYGIDGEIDAINRQFSDGADFVLVATSDYEAMKEYIQKQPFADKVVFVKNGIYGDMPKNVMTDDYKLGKDFANYILDKSDANKLVMVTTKEDSNTLEIMKGMQEVFADSPIKIEYRLLSATS